MKKIVTTMVVILGMVLSVSAQEAERGFFGKGESANRDGIFGFMMPDIDVADNEPAYPSSEEAPIGSGAMLLIGFGAAYAMSRRQKEE